MLEHYSFDKQLLQIQWSIWENRNEILHNKDHIWQSNKQALSDKEISNIFDSDMEYSFLQGDMIFLNGGIKWF